MKLTYSFKYTILCTSDDDRFCIQAHTKIFKYIMACGKNVLKHILTYLYCRKYNEINIFQSDVQKHVSYAEAHKKIFIHFELCLEMIRNVFSIVYHGLFLSC